VGPPGHYSGPNCSAMAKPAHRLSVGLLFAPKMNPAIITHSRSNKTAVLMLASSESGEIRS